MKGTPPIMFESEKQIIQAFEDDPRTIELEIADRRQKLDQINDGKDLEMKRIEANERMSREGESGSNGCCDATMHDGTIC